MEDTPSVQTLVPERTAQKLPENSTYYGDFNDVSYPHVASLQSWDQIQSRSIKFRKAKGNTRLEGLSDLYLVQTIKIRPRAQSEDSSANYTYDLNDEKNKNLYLATIIKSWSSAQCKLQAPDGTPRLMYFCRSVGCSCYSRTFMGEIHTMAYMESGINCSKMLVLNRALMEIRFQLSVTHERDLSLGSVEFRGGKARLFDANGNKVLEIVSKFEDDFVEHIIVEVDSTRVGKISESTITLTKYIDAIEKALILGAWIPIVLNTEFTKLHKPKKFALAKHFQPHKKPHHRYHHHRNKHEHSRGSGKVQARGNDNVDPITPETAPNPGPESSAPTQVNAKTTT